MEPTPYIICSLNDIPSRKAYGFQLMALDDAGEVRPLPLVVVRWGKHVFGYINRCPHHGVNLDWERQAFLDPDYGTKLMCGKHGALFDLATGECVQGPCLGQGLTPVALAVLDGDICITGVRLVEDGGPDASEEVRGHEP